MDTKQKKSRKHIILPLCIALYFAVIAYVNRSESGEVSYWIKIIVEVIVLALLSFVIKKREYYRNIKKDD